jgi:hypothetical protein
VRCFGRPDSQSRSDVVDSDVVDSDVTRTGRLSGWCEHDAAVGRQVIAAQSGDGGTAGGSSGASMYPARCQQWNRTER